MTLDQFKAKVEEFIRLYCTDYFDCRKVDYIIEDDLHVVDEVEETVAELTLTGYDGQVWKLSLGVDQIVESTLIIDIDGEGSHFDADGGGLFCFLWFEACRRLREAKSDAT